MTEWQNVKTSELVRLVAIEDRAASTMAMLMRSEAAAELDRRFPVQPAAPVSGWQPIESAPTNREVLIYTSHHLFDVALKEPDGRWWPARTGKPLACGVVAWMPLPEVPK